MNLSVQPAPFEIQKAVITHLWIPVEIILGTKA